MEFEISITSYATGIFDYWEVYDLDSYVTAIEEFNEKYNKHDGDYEVQMIETSNPNVKEEDLYDLFKFLDENPDKEDDLDRLLYEYTLEESISLIEDYSITVLSIIAENKLSAFIEYYEDMGYEMPPESFRDYIDWERIMEDHEQGDLDIFQTDKYKDVSNGYFPIRLREFVFVI